MCVPSLAAWIVSTLARWAQLPAEPPAVLVQLRLLGYLSCALLGQLSCNNCGDFSRAACYQEGIVGHGRQPTR